MKKRKPLWLTGEAYLESFRLAPRIGINLLIKNKQGEFLLTTRTIPPALGWHFPGSMLLRNETLQNCLIRTAKKELSLNLSLKTSFELRGVFDDLDSDPRGHFIDIIYELIIQDKIEIKTTAETEEFKFFKNIPQNTFIAHQIILKQLGYK